MNPTHKYDDIIHNVRHISMRRSPMTQYDRAAQFSPFAALTGHEEAIAETARLTDSAIELGEDGISMLNEKLRCLEPGQDVTVVYFRPDARKAGGAYVRHTGKVKRLEDHRGVLVMADGMEISFGRICDICDIII